MRLENLSADVLREEVRLLRERVEFLEEENRQLRETVLTKTWEPPIELGLTPQEKIVFTTLRNHDGTCSKQYIMDMLYSLRPNDVAEEKIIDVYICKIRKKIKEFGLTIETVWGQGYVMPAASKGILANWGQELEEAA